MKEHKNQDLQKLIVELKTAQAPVWRAVALHLERPTRHRAALNVGSLNRFTKEGEMIVVPGKVLGEGNLDHTITIAALGFSGSAEIKLKAAKATSLSIRDALKKDPKGKTVRILA